MTLLIEMVIVWAGAAALAFTYQLTQRRRLVVAVHYAVIFALAIMALYAVAAVFSDVLDLRPEGRLF